LGVGDQVQIIGVGQTGVVVGGPDRDGNFLVQVSSLKVNVPRDRLARPAKVSKAPRGSASTPVLITTPYLDVDTSGVSSEIHLRGLTVDLALADLDRYLDQAFIAGLGEVRVIHGKGTGKLRREVQRFLSSHPLVDSYRLGGHGEGSFGVTMVTLKRKR
ncbi:MAG: Smr/MutS family protein, partial [Firmicutes bacterium]|nr:Smr/MutS family protein [Bacillota bacterium]